MVGMTRVGRGGTGEVSMTSTGRRGRDLRGQYDQTILQWSAQSLGGQLVSSVPRGDKTTKATAIEAEPPPPLDLLN